MDGEISGRQENRPERNRRIWGLGTGKGVEGKIKANSAKALLSHCLHIFFWGAARKAHGAVKWAKTPVVWGIFTALSPSMSRNVTVSQG
jgi:hypothetical protein